MDTVSLKKYSVVLGCALLVACTQDGQAPVQDKGKIAYRYNSHVAESEAQDYAPASTGRSGDADSDDAQPVFKSGYKRNAKSAAVEDVGVEELPTPGSTRAKRRASNTIAASNDASPFGTPPSKPLESHSDTIELQAPKLQTASVMPPAVSTTKNGISLIQPVNGGRIISHFKGEANDGVNIAANEGEPVVASASGMVVYTGSDVKSYGNMVVLRHDNGWLTAYGNNSKILVKKNDYVKQGDIIAFVGSTGGVKSPQLHFALRNGKTPIDPEKYLPVN